MKKIRICLIGNFLSGYGFTPQICESLHSKFVKEGYSVVIGGHFRNKIFRVFEMMLTLLIKKNEYDLALISTFSGNAFYWAYLSGNLCKLLGKPYIPVLHGGNLPEFGKKRSFFVKSYLKNAKKIVSPSLYLKKWAEELGFNATEIYNHIDLESYTFKQRKSIKPKLYWVRRYHSIYNPQMAVRVFAKIKGKYSDASLMMAGPDSGEKQNCIKLAKQSGVFKDIEFKDKLTKKEINKLGQKRDIFINTTHIDNTPVTLIEAAAMGLPIVSTNVGGIPDLFADGKEALLVGDNNIDGMAEAIDKLIKNSGLVKKITIKARSKVEEFDWEKVRLKWEKLFEEIENG
jgi:glycosyltransferase involved in cell wall biosynthesis